jgi:hypothetical protein
VSDQHPIVVQQRGAVAVAGDVVDAFKTSPVLLLIVLLNMAFCGAAAYYLLRVEDYRAADRVALFSLLEKCTMHTVPIEALERRPPLP